MKFRTDSPLSAYLSSADNVQVQLMTRPKLNQLLADVDVYWRNEVLAGELAIDPITAPLLLQSFYLWLATVRTALSGHSMAVMPVLRASLEAACYAYRLSHHPELRDIWRHRDRSEADRKMCRKRLGEAHSDTVKALTKDHRPLAEAVDEMYDASITFGGHPNPRFILDHVTIEDEADGYVPVRVAGINPPDAPNTARTVLAAVELGLTAGLLSALCAPSHPRADSLVAAFDALQERKENLFQRHGQLRTPD